MITHRRHNSCFEESLEFGFDLKARDRKTDLLQNNQLNEFLHTL